MGVDQCWYEQVAGLTEGQAHLLVRADPVQDDTHGFFVARFARVSAEDQPSSEAVPGEASRGVSMAQRAKKRDKRRIKRREERASKKQRRAEGRSEEETSRDEGQDSGAQGAFESSFIMATTTSTMDLGADKRQE